MSAVLESLPPPTTLIAGRYEVVSRLAQGGMGEVFHARELASGREVALKRLLHTAERPRMLFQAEYHALARLRHPYIVEVFDYGLDGDRPFYTMELLSGSDLRDSPRESIPGTCQNLRDVATSLALLHAQRLVHRDISPRNVRKTASGRCKLFDFGTMVPFGVPPNVAGTSPFISPEAWDGALLDQRSDLYSLGALAYWLFSGQLHAPPRPLDRRRAERVLPTRLSRIVSGLPAALDDLIMAMLEPDPGKRPWSAHDVIAELSAAANLPHDDTLLLAHSHLGSSRMVGRRREMATTTRALTHAQQYEGGALLVEGVPGVGKSRLLQEIAWLGQTHGFAVVRGFGGQAEGGLGVAAQLYAQLKRCLPDAEKRLSDSERRSLATLDPLRSEVVSDANDNRAQLQWSLTALVRAITRETAVLVVVDDLDLADEFSAAFVTALAHVAKTRPLLVVASCAPTYGVAESSEATPFAGVARTLTLNPLNSHETRAFVAEVLGRPPQYARFAEWAYREAHGNPAATLDLTAWLVRRGVVGYANGRFVLPEGDILEPLPGEAGRPLLLRLLGLPKSAVSLLELLTLCRSGGTLALCVAATSMDPSAVMEALDELVRSGVLMGAGHAYAFAQASLRTALREDLSAKAVTEIHVQLARAYLMVDSDTPASKLEAGFHLLHTERALEGALLLVEVCPVIIAAGIEPGAALEALEHALAVLEKHPNTLTHRLRVRTVLARSSYLFDYRLAQRHEARTIEELTRWNGVHTMRHALPYVGSLVVLAACLIFVTVRRCFRPRADRGPGPYESMQLMARALLSYVGVRALQLDGPGAMNVLSYLSVFRNAPPPTSGGVVYLCSNALSVQPFGRESELERAAKHALDVLNANRLLDMTEHEQRDMRVGLMLSRGINECYRIGSQALALADALEAEGTPIARAAAHRVRFTYYVARGMRDKSERFRRKLEIHGIQGGTTWQVEWFAAPLIGMTSVHFGDIVGATEAMERLTRLSAELPSLKPMLELVRLGHQMLTRDFAAAIAGGERFVRNHPPKSLIGWGSGHAAYARALNEVGRHSDALTVCKNALAAVAGPDEDYVIMYGNLSLELALAYAGLGESEKASTLLDAQTRRLVDAGEHALLAHGHGKRILLARVTQDHPMLTHSLIAMREAADRSGSSTVVHQAARIARASGRATDDLLALALPASEHVSAPTTTETGTARGSDRAATPRKGIAVSKRRSLLRRVMDHANAQSALLFARPEANDVPPVLASAGEEAFHETLEAHAADTWTHILAAAVDAPPFAIQAVTLPGSGHSCSVMPIFAPDDPTPVALLYFVSESTGPLEPPPTTWLSELAQRAQTSRSQTAERPEDPARDPSDELSRA